MARTGTTIRIEGLRELLKKLDGDAVLGQPIKHALNQIGAFGETRAKQRAPRASGRLSAGISHKMDVRPIPLWTKVGYVNGAMPTNKGFRYPYALNASKKRIYHYAGTKKKTYRWLSGVMAQVRRQFGSLIQNAAREIESNWRR